MIFAAAEPKSFMETYLPYMVLATGLIAAVLFLAYFMATTDRRKRLTGTFLAILLAGFSVFCITEGDGVKRGIDLKGGASFLVRVQPSGDKAVTPGALAQAQAIIDKRLNPTGSKDVTVTPQGSDRLYVEVPGLTDEQIRQSKETIEKVARLEFRLLSPEGRTLIKPGDAPIKPGFTKMRYIDEDEEEQKKIAAMTPAERRKRPKSDKFIWVKNKAEMSGKSVDNAWAQLIPGATNFEISVELHSEYGDKMMELTRANTGKPMAILLENTPGEFDVISAPNIKNPFGARFVIEGKFTEEEAIELSGQLMNPLENPLLVEQSSIISPTYGKETVQQGLTSTMVGLGLTLLFMMLYYRLSGIIAVIGLVINLLLLLGAMRIFDQTLTMPGIAGIILTLGMAIDANVLIYERMREEFQAGRTLDTAINASYDKAFSAIFDSNLTTLITSVIMITIATGAIQGFGLALTIGLIASMFSALVITRVCFLWLHKSGLKTLSFMSLIQNRLYDFMGKRKLWLTISAVICAACVAVVAIKGNKVLGYELRGGDQISLKGIPGVDLAAVEKSLADWNNESKESLNIGTVKPLGAEEYINLRTAPGTSASIKAELIKDLAAGDTAKATLITNASTETMGSSVGGEMLTRSIWAIVIGLIGIFIYLTFRFEMPFAIGGIVAIFHDVIVAVGVCAIAGKEIGLILIGAFLTIAGYSINDTIVIFDRVRENLRTKKGDLKEILNQSISDTLSRTIITSGVTGLAVLAMYLFGGKAMADFSFTMLIGMISGVYSTIFIASPVVLWWAERRQVNLRQAILDADAQKLEAISGLEREAPAKPSKKKKDGDDSIELTPV